MHFDKIKYLDIYIFGKKMPILAAHFVGYALYLKLINPF